MQAANDHFFTGLSKKGPVRKENQDFYGFSFNQNNLLIVVCDGLGGYKGGKIASNLVGKLFLSLFEGFEFNQWDETTVKKWFENTLIQARFQLENCFQTVYEAQIQFARMASTLVLGILTKSDIYIFWIGDSRAYLLFENQAKLVTKDHNLYNQLVAMNADEKLLLSYSNQLLALTNTISKETKRPLVYGFYNTKIEQQEFLLLCSDGFYNFVEKELFFEIITNSKNLKQAVFNLYRKSIENESNDNITAALVNLQKWKQS
ncbi:PP2C family protein-serine/threonine phosphatase [Mycoplasmoides genitalium]